MTVMTRDIHFTNEIRIILFVFIYNEFSSVTFTNSCSVLEGSVILCGHPYYLE